MQLINMDLITGYVTTPLNKWNKNYISPGKVGSVGDTIATTRLKQSAPELAPRYEDWNSGINEIFYGSNVQDGTESSFNTSGLGARTIQRPVYRYTGYKTAQGWEHQDIVPTDRTYNVKMAGLPQFGWKSQVASIYRAKVSGDSFLPLPGGYGPNSLPRGNQYPLLVSRSNAQTVPSSRSETVVVQAADLVSPTDGIQRIVLGR